MVEPGAYDKRVVATECKVFTDSTPAGSHLRVEIRRIRELLHHHMAEMMKQRVLVNRILHFRYFDEVFQLKALHLKKGASRR